MWGRQEEAESTSRSWVTDCTQEMETPGIRNQPKCQSELRWLKDTAVLAKKKKKVVRKEGLLRESRQWERGPWPILSPWKRQRVGIIEIDIFPQGFTHPPCAVYTCKEVSKGLRLSKGSKETPFLDPEGWAAGPGCPHQPDSQLPARGENQVQHKPGPPLWCWLAMHRELGTRSPPGNSTPTEWQAHIWPKCHSAPEHTL